MILLTKLNTLRNGISGNVYNVFLYIKNADNINIMERRLYSLISLMFGLFIYLGIATNRPGPLVFILILFLSILAFFGRFSIRNSELSSYPSNSDEALRLNALNEAKIFLAPYKNIWRDLRLSNKYCSITLGHDGVTIKCIEKVPPYRKMQITKSHIHTPQELWNLFCIYFSHNKSYDGVKEDCDRFHASTIESADNIITANETVKPKQEIKPTGQSEKITTSKRLDINNCSEIELTELPGISIVLAKKTIKRREEVGGFKSVDEFLNFIRLKPHMENQLRDKIKVEKMKGSLYQKRYNERSVDF